VTRSQSARRGEEAGVEARRSLGLNEAQPLDDVLRSLERTTDLQVFVRPLGFDGIAGAYWVSQEVPFVLLNADHPVERQRFTLAHEFGHHRLGHGNQVDQQLAFGTSSPREVEANAFAASFLMPPAAIGESLAELEQPQMTFDVLITLAALFGVSAKAMRIRLETLSELKPQQIAQFDAMIEAEKHHGRAARLGVSPVSDSLALAKQDGGRLPPQMERKVIAALEHDILPEDVAVKLLRTTTAGLASLRARYSVASE
jgi:Zn-dependent peptidase ImmA (M78 family)